MASEEQKQSWEKAEKFIEKGKHDEALQLLRDVDSSGSNAETWKLAGDAKLGLARNSEASKPKALYRQSRAHYYQSLKINPGNKKTRSSLDTLLNEMQNRGISETSLPQLFKDGTPTLYGIVAIPVAFLIVLAGIKYVVAEESTELAGDVELTITWTDKSGNAHIGTITIELDDANTPIHAKNFRLHASQGNYDTTVFHRIVDNFMVQGGDVEHKSGSGGYAAEYFGYCMDGSTIAAAENCPEQVNWKVPAEFGEPHIAGAIAAARSQDDNSAGSQFYMVDTNGAASLDGKYTAFGFAHSGTIDGIAVDGIDVIDAISEVECQTADGICVDGAGSKSVHPVTLTQAKLVDEQSGGILSWLGL
ncbi:MAG: peptidylprolyl isomerase [Candidatus Poseidoniaceae archaeon]|jgi:peptidyl-prolyl cis-trans isomerase B (cyclophilin B)|nr:peptidylprolyl isomerase [Candidatus Poseidoniaceae archaeon]